MNWFQIGLLPISFALGSIPFAVIIGRLAGVDVLTQGSNNPGASNVYRLAGPPYGILVFILDAAKGAAPALAALYLSAHDAHLESSGVDPVLRTWLELGAGFCAGLGHIFSPFLRFRGGKGVATFLGMFMVVFPAGILLAGGVAAAAILVTRYFSVGSIAGAIILPLSYFLFYSDFWAKQNVPILCVSALAAALILFRHRENILRLVRGTEHKTRSNV